MIEGPVITQFSFNTQEPEYGNLREVDVMATDQIDGTTLWAVRQHTMGRVISRRGSIRLEPRPSERTDWFLKAYRFSALEEALYVADLWATELRRWIPNQTPLPTRIRIPSGIDVGYHIDGSPVGWWLPDEGSPARTRLPSWPE